MGVITNLLQVDGGNINIVKRYAHIHTHVHAHVHAHAHIYTQSETPLFCIPRDQCNMFELEGFRINGA